MVNLRTAFIVVGLIAITVLAMGRMVWDGHEFLLFDDTGYITRNEALNAGIRWQTVKWAFNPATIVVGNYHPLTNLSHALDVQLFGRERPWLHHLVNLAIHIANTLLLFAVLRRMTGDEWPSALVAALFAWHPMHVESVAWASERKDVLSALFWIVAMGFYASYVRGSRLAYVGVFAALLLGLLAKPMVVTLPFALLLLDYWPLRRYPSGSEFWPTARRLVVEKLPLFALVLVFIPLTLWAQSRAGAVTSVEVVPLGIRIVNALYSYNMYLTKMAWPTGLAVPYPLYMRKFTLESILLGGIGFALVTYLVVARRKQLPYLPVGWFWYVGTLVPVIGLVQVGSQAMADRYTYLPSIGLFMALAWGLQDLVRSESWARRIVPAASVLLLAVLALMTYRQVGYWRDTVTLFSRTAERYPEVFTAHYGLAVGYLQKGDVDRAMQAIDQALELRPKSGMAWHCKGYALLLQGNKEEAIAAIEQSLEFEPRVVERITDVGWIKVQLGEMEGAGESFQRSLELSPRDFRALLGRGVVALRAGRRAEAHSFLRAAQEVYPQDPAVSMLLARLLATSPTATPNETAEAVRLSEWVCDNMPELLPSWLDTLGAAYAAQGEFEKAAQAAQRGHELALERHDVETAAEIEGHLEHFRSGERLTEEAAAIRAEKILRLDALISQVQD